MAPYGACEVAQSNYSSKQGTVRNRAISKGNSKEKKALSKVLSKEKDKFGGLLSFSALQTRLDGPPRDWRTVRDTAAGPLRTDSRDAQDIQNNQATCFKTMFVHTILLLVWWRGTFHVHNTLP